MRIDKGISGLAASFWFDRSAAPPGPEPPSPSRMPPGPSRTQRAVSCRRTGTSSRQRRWRCFPGFRPSHSSRRLQRPRRDRKLGRRIRPAAAAAATATAPPLSRRSATSSAPSSPASTPRSSTLFAASSPTPARARATSTPRSSRTSCAAPASPRSRASRGRASRRAPRTLSSQASSPPWRSLRRVKVAARATMTRPSSPPSSPPAS